MELDVRLIKAEYAFFIVLFDGAEQLSHHLQILLSAAHDFAPLLLLVLLVFGALGDRSGREAERQDNAPCETGLLHRLIRPFR
jgi:hypothetical protein